MQLVRARAATPLITALSDRVTLEPFARFIDGLVIAIERGTPLANVLRAHAADVREVGKRALLDVACRKEISMTAAASIKETIPSA